MENKMANAEAHQFGFQTMARSTRRSEGENITLLILIFIAMVSVGCQHPEATTSKAGQIKPNKDCPYELSQSFRDAAGDAFDKLQSLESNELQGKLFYQPAYQEAGVAVSKVERISSNADEVKFSDMPHYIFLK
jgi:hypothetical protein